MNKLFQNISFAVEQSSLIRYVKYKIVHFDGLVSWARYAFDQRSQSAYDQYRFDALYDNYLVHMQAFRENIYFHIRNEPAHLLKKRIDQFFGKVEALVNGLVSTVDWYRTPEITR